MHRLFPVSNVSLCHSADAIVERKKRIIEMISNDGINNDSVVESLDLPASRTDW